MRLLGAFKRVERKPRPSRDNARQHMINGTTSTEFVPGSWEILKPSDNDG